MADVMDSTKAWLPDEGFLSNPTCLTSIKAHIRIYMLELTKSDLDMENTNFLGPFCTILLQFERFTKLMKKKEALTSLEGMWDEFTKLNDFVPPSISNSSLTPQNSIQNSAATKRKTNVMDDESFIHPAK